MEKSRDEIFLEGILNGEVPDIEPQSRIETYLKEICLCGGVGSGEAGDTLPYGTIVEYDGTEVPEGYEEVEGDVDIDLSNYYTKEEVDNQIPSLDDYVKTEELPDTSNFVEKETGKGLFSGSYNDLTDKPEIDTELNTESENAIANSIVATKFNEIYSDDASDLTTTYTVKNATAGITMPTTMNYSYKHIKTGKIHYIMVTGGAKVYNTATATYEVTVNIEVPINAIAWVKILSEPSTNITAVQDPTVTLLTNSTQIKITYTQPNSTSSYSPDSLYFIKEAIMLIEN